MFRLREKGIFSSNVILPEDVYSSSKGTLWVEMDSVSLCSDRSPSSPHLSLS